MTRSSCLTVLVAAFLLGGCGLTGAAKQAPPPKPLSRAEFMHRANHACASASLRMKRLKKATSFSMLVREENVAIRSFEQIIVAFRRLTPPRSEAAAFRRVLADLDALDISAHRIVDAVEARQVQRVRTLARNAKPFTKGLKRRLKNLGLRICARG